MKNIIVITLLLFIGCNKKNNDTTAKLTDEKTSPKTEKNVTVDVLVENYLSMKNALAEGSGEKTAEFGKTILSNAKVLLGDQKNKNVSDILSDIQENAEHISENADKVPHQREHFQILSKDFEDLIAKEKYSKTLYKDFCPMYDGNKGAYWLSEQKEINNPYQPTMKTCGEVKQVIPAR